MSAAVVEMWTTAGMRKALRFAPHITLSRESKAAECWLSEEPLIRRRPGRPIVRTAGVIWSVAKARARHDHNSGPLQVSKASLEVRDFPTDGEGQGSSQ